MTRTFGLEVCIVKPLVVYRRLAVGEGTEVARRRAAVRSEALVGWSHIIDVYALFSIDVLEEIGIFGAGGRGLDVEPSRAEPSLVGQDPGVTEFF